MAAAAAVVLAVAAAVVLVDTGPLPGRGCRLGTFQEDLLLDCSGREAVTVPVLFDVSPSLWCHLRRALW